jgi:tetratricopeptide (TPR) repeat protein
MYTLKSVFLSFLLITPTPLSVWAQPHDLVPGTIAPVSPLVMARPHAEWLGQAQSLERQRNWNGLLELGRQWTQAESRKALAWFVLGRAASELGRHDEAIAAYERALRIEPDDIYSINNLGNAYRDSGRPRQAMQLWREAVRINPGYLQAWNNLGTTFYATQGPGWRGSGTAAIAGHRPGAGRGLAQAGNRVFDQPRRAGGASSGRGAAWSERGGADTDVRHSLRWRLRKAALVPAREVLQFRHRLAQTAGFLLRSHQRAPSLPVADEFGIKLRIALRPRQ